MKKFFTKKSKIVLVIALIVLVMFLLFSIYLKVTEYDRYRKKEMNSIEKSISYNIESDKTNSFSFYFTASKYDELSMRLVQDEEFHEFMSIQAKRIVEEKPESIWNFVREFDFVYIDDVVQESVVDAYENLRDLKSVFAARESLDLLKRTNEYMLNDEHKKRIAYAHKKDSKIISTYINENGIEDISINPGEGYYADKVSSHNYDVVGLKNSPLYDSSDTKYFGDFMCMHGSGVRLNKYYEESYYNEKDCYFRDEKLSCCPSDGECIVSGDYLFVFANDGRMLGIHKFE